MSLHVRQQSSNPLISDYESEANNLIDLLPPTDRTPEELNLSVLRRHDNTVVALAYVAPYVVVYTFSPDSQGWEKSGVEGTAFICRLSPTAELPSRYAVMILNRRGLDNFRLEITGGASVEVADDIVIFQSEATGTMQIHGFWVYSEPSPSSTSQHREGFANTIRQCSEEVERSQQARAEQVDGCAEDGAQMSRQVSLKEIFGQQRQQDDSWSVRSHSPHGPPPKFTTTADTDFFRSSKRHGAPSPTANPSADHAMSLLDMIRNAGNSRTS